MPAGCTLAAAGNGSLTVAGITNAPAASYPATSWTIVTSSDTNTASPASAVTLGASTSPTAVTFSATTRAAITTGATWTAQFSSSASGALSAGDTIAVSFPNGFLIPDTPVVALTGAGYAGCAAPSASTAGTTVTITLGAGCTLAASSLGTLTIAGITNPIEGTYAKAGFTVATSRDMTSTMTGANIDIFGLPTTFSLAPASGTPAAGAADNLTITALDSGGRTVASYTGDHSLTFSGANSSTNPVTTPKVTDKVGTATSFGTATTITFTNGIATVAGANNGVMKLYKVESPTVSVTDGSISGNASLTVGPAAATRLIVTGAGTQTAGTAQSLTITAADAFGNTDTSYTGSHSLTFSGANSSTNPVTAPTVTNNAAAAINFGSATAITFANGVSTVGGSMKLFKAESASRRRHGRHDQRCRRRQARRRGRARPRPRSSR